MDTNERRLYNRIKKEIDKHIDEYSFSHEKHRWYSGITNDPTRRLDQHKKKKNVMYPKIWNTKSVEVAHELEKYCSHKGFQNTDNFGGAKPNSFHFYIFKTNLTIGDYIVDFFGLKV